jgi:hypothetical protein
VIEPAERPLTRHPRRADRLARALSFGLTGGEAPMVALAGFLLRGGIVLLALPAVILPSVIGVAGATGVDAISIAGQPTPWLAELIALAILGAVGWLVLAGLVGSVVDVWMIEMTMEPGLDRPRHRLPLPPLSVVLRLLAIRMICLVPLAVALGWAATRIFNAAYDELTTPSSLATPLPLRVLFAAADAVAVVTLVWLATETIAAIAVRRQVLAGRGIWWSLVGTAGQIVRRPISTLLTVVVSYATSAVAIGLAMVGTSTAFDWCRIAARNEEPVAIKLGIAQFSTTRDFRPVVFALAAVALALAWAAALAISAVAAAWRSASFTGEVVDALAARAEPAGGAAQERGLGLSGALGERSGD